METIRRDVFISWADLVRLEHQIEMARLQSRQDGAHLDRLKAQLDVAQIIGRQDAPPDVVTLHTRVRLRDPATGATADYELVFPNQADPANGKISVLAPLGAALLGSREHEVARWETPAGPREMIVDRILYRPEIDEDYRL